MKAVHHQVVVFLLMKCGEVAVVTGLLVDGMMQV
jgi:hypothetical protein